MLNCKIAYIDKDPNKNKTNHQHRFLGSNMQFFSLKRLHGDEFHRFDPDIVFINKGDIPVNISQLINGRHSVYWYGDWRSKIPNLAVTWAKMCNVALFNVYDDKLWDLLREQGQRNIFTIHQGVDTEVFRPLDNCGDVKYDITFGANYFGSGLVGSELRLSTVRYLKTKGYNVTVIGDGWPNDINAISWKPEYLLNKIYNQSKITLGISHFTDIPFATSNRLYQCMAVGVPHIAWHVSQIDKLFNDSYIGVKSFGELTGWIDYLLENKTARQRIGSAQRCEILARHTLQHACQRIENIIAKIFNLKSY